MNRGQYERARAAIGPGPLARWDLWDQGRDCGCVLGELLIARFDRETLLRWHRSTPTDAGGKPEEAAAGYYRSLPDEARAYLHQEYGIGEAEAVALMLANDRSEEGGRVVAVLRALAMLADRQRSGAREPARGCPSR